MEPRFSRETKFLLTSSEAHRVRIWARRAMAADPHGGGVEGDEYRTTTLYFDTPGFDVLHRRGPFGRSKFRVRRYGTADVAFLERKLRTDGVLVKRRTALPLEELARLESEPARGWSGHWFHKRLVKRALRPSCQLSYTRIARISDSEAGPLRLTLDDDLRAVVATRTQLAQPGGVPVLGGDAILELKYRAQPPALFRQLIDHFGLTPQPVSKYRLGAAALGEPI